MERAHIRWFQIIPPDDDARRSFLIPHELVPSEKRKCRRIHRNDEMGAPVECGKPAVAEVNVGMFLCPGCLAGWREDRKLTLLKGFARTVPYEVVEALGEGWLAKQLGCDDGRPKWEIVVDGPLTFPEPDAKVVDIGNLFG